MQFQFQLKCLLASALFLPNILACSFAQLPQNNLEIRVRNDDAGEVSNWMHSGDDLGETQSIFLEVNLQNIHPKNNFHFKIESTEYSALALNTSETRDIYFSELNNFQLSIDNNKFQNHHYFSSFSAGIYCMQYNYITLGATGEKYYWHKWLVNKFYENKNWVYLNSHLKTKYIPYAEYKFGRNDTLYNLPHFSIQTSNQALLKIASNKHFSGIGARTFFDFCWSNTRFKLNALHLEMEGNYLSNVVQSQCASIQAQLKFASRHFACYGGINKPLAKNLHNPYIKYDDMEWLFNYGIQIIM